MSRVRQFLERLWPETSKISNGRRLTLWRVKDRQSSHLPLDFDAISRTSEDWTRAGHDVYFGVGLRKEGLPDSRLGGENDTMMWPCVWVDIDLHAPWRAAQNLPRTVDDVDPILSEFVIPPTDIVHSGYGLHAYWLFDQPQENDRRHFKKVLVAWQQLLRDQFAARGWHLDDTAKLQQVLRLPGTLNWKGMQPQEVLFFWPGETRISFAELEKAANVARSRRTSSEVLKERQEQKAQKLASKAPAAAGSVPEALDEPPAATATAAAPADGESEMPDWVAESRRRLRKMRNADHREVALKLLKGTGFADRGERNVVCNRIVGAVVYVVLRVKRDADVQEIYDWFFKTSIEFMAATDPHEPLTEAQVVNQIVRACGNFADDEETKRVAELRVASALQKLSARRGRGEGNGHAGHGPYGGGDPRGGDDSGGANGVNGANGANGTHAGSGGAAGEDAAHVADPPPSGDQHDPESPEAVRRALRQLIIQNDTEFYVFRDGMYRKPIRKESLELKLRDDFEGVEGVDWFKYDGSGNLRRKTLQEMLNDYGTAARETVYDLNIRESYFDPATEIMHIACAPFRQLEPTFNPQIHKWLNIFGGEDAELLLDWIATLTRLEKRTCAIYVSGPPGTGKSTLAYGLARLWTAGTPTEISDALGSFNADLLRCPFIVADEAISKTLTTTALRKIIGTTEHVVRRKFMPNVQLHGAVRLMLCGNNENMLHFEDDDIGYQDLIATAGRFLHIATSEESAKYLLSINGAVEQKWIEQDLIARHALWLRDNRKVVADGRFWVQGHQTRVTNTLLFKDRSVNAASEWIIRFLSNPKLGNEPLRKNFIVCGEGELLINTLALADYWPSVLPQQQTPTITRIGRALHQLSSEQRRIGTQRYWVMLKDNLMAWAGGLGLDVDTMLARVEGARLAAV